MEMVRINYIKINFSLSDYPSCSIIVIPYQTYSLSYIRVVLLWVRAGGELEKNRRKIKVQWAYTPRSFFKKNHIFGVYI